jgi:pimeloyl-ACP methyl ester carboxylesterase
MDNRTPAPELKFNHIELPLTKLHYVTCGEGPPLIMVPATISKLSNWLPFAQFFGQRFTVYFFELPGHGKSTPFAQAYSSKLVAESVGAFLDQLGYSSAALLGFSFGGILALHTLNHLRERINKVIFISPCVSQNAIILSDSRKVSLRKLLTFLRTPVIQHCVVKILHSKRFGYNCAALFRKLGKVENTIPLEAILCGLPASTVDVLIYQACEILKCEFPLPKSPLLQKCYFAMSINDPVLDFQTTYDFLDVYFQEVFTARFTFPYHQPAVLPTFSELNQDYGHFLSMI